MERLATLAVMVLTMLENKDSELSAQDMVLKSGGELTLYSLHLTLSRMEDAELIRSKKKLSENLRSKRIRKYYKSTAAGRKEIVAWNKMIARLKK